MTYTSSVSTYEFTAFSAADLLAAGDKALSCGDCFTMPAGATACFSVRDDDRYLSGDGSRSGNENATDKSHQTASIMVDGKEVGNGGQIYAETKWTLRGSDGKCYTLIEIEQECADGDFFTFEGAVPPAGVKLTVVSGCDIGCVDYACLGAGPKVEPGSICGRLTFDADGNDNEWNDVTGQWDAGVDGKTVELIDSNGNVVATAVTDHYGSYSFDNVPAGDYKVKFPLPEGFRFSAKDSGVDEHFDSDANPDGLTDTIHVGNGQKIANVDAGIRQDTGTVTGTVFCDLDCNGIDGTVTTVAGHDYVIEAESMHRSGFVVANSTVASGGKIVKLNCAGGHGDLTTCFTGKTGTYDVTIRVQDECDGKSVIYFKVDGHLVEAVKLDRNTDGGGHDSGAYSDFVIKDVKINAGSEIKLWVDGDSGEFVRIDKLTFEGEDTVTRTPEPVKEGVTVKLLALDGSVIATTTTGADGTYTFAKVPVGDYRIMGVAPDGTEFTIQDAGTDDTIDSDVDGTGLSGVVSVLKDKVSDIDLGVCEKDEGGIAGRAFFDSDGDSLDLVLGVPEGEAGITGVRVDLQNLDGSPALDIDGNVVPSTFTDANGNYAFGNLPAGNYQVVFADVPNRLFVETDIGSDDTIDSDVFALDGGGGFAAPVVVVEGLVTDDIDAGYFALPV